jgi:hypothetical protein
LEHYKNQSLKTLIRNGRSASNHSPIIATTKQQFSLT